jgi:hypothetical protein
MRGERLTRLWLPLSETISGIAFPRPSASRILHSRWFRQIAEVLRYAGKESFMRLIHSSRRERAAAQTGCLHRRIPMSGMPKSSQDQPLPASDLLSLDEARNRLAVIWMGGGGIFIIILVLQCLLNVYDDKVQEVWGWALPTIMPTLGMIVAVLGYTALDPYASGTVVRRSFFRAAWWLSLFYISLVLLTVLIQPFAPPAKDYHLGSMHLSNLWLGPVQGLVATALGVLFVSKRKPNEETDSSKRPTV